MEAHNQPLPANDRSVELRVPATFNLKGVAPPMAGAAPEQEPAGADPTTTCTFKAHQLICVSGEVVTTVTPTCTTTVKCLNGGIGQICPPGTPPPCTFKFFQNLCVEVDVSVTGTSECILNPPQCLGVETGPCPSP